MSQRKYSANEKLNIINFYIKGPFTMKETAENHGISLSTFREWIKSYRNHGVSALEKKSGWTIYSKELKSQAVREVLEENKSLRSVTEKFNISSRSVLKKWITKHNSQIND